jgi:hypothetical protein
MGTGKERKMIALFFIGWFLFGAFNVYLCGKIDKITDGSGAPINLMFVTGPVSTVFLVPLYLFYKLSEESPLKFLYDWGRK